MTNYCGKAKVTEFGNYLIAKTYNQFINDISKHI